MLSFYAGPERYPELLESESFLPAPYMARIYWVAVPRWSDVSRTQLEPLLRLAHSGVSARLPRRTLELLALPKTARDKVVEERKAALSAHPPKLKSRPKRTAGARDA